MLPESPSPRDRYLLGALAPRNGLVEASLFDGATSGTGGGSVAEDKPAPPPRLPNSIGLTFSVPPETAAIAVTSRWGSYRKVKRLGIDVAGRVGFANAVPEDELTVWERTQHEGLVRIALDERDDRACRDGRLA